MDTSGQSSVHGALIGKANGRVSAMRCVAGVVLNKSLVLRLCQHCLQVLEAMLEERQTPEERERDALRERGYGPTSSLATLRLFDAPEGTGKGKRPGTLLHTSHVVDAGSFPHDPPNYLPVCICSWWLRR